MQTIQGLIRSEIKDFTEGYVYPVEGWSYSQYKTIKRAHLYIASQFEEPGQVQDLDMLFYNIINPSRETWHKFFNVDTKDIRAKAINGTQKAWLQALLLEKMSHKWMRKQGYARKLNEFTECLADFGSSFWYVNNGDVSVVDVRNLFNDPSVDSIQDSAFVTLKQELPRHKLEEMSGKWENVDTLLSKFKGTEKKSYVDQAETGTKRRDGYYTIYTRYGYVPKSMLDGKEGAKDAEKMVRSLFIVAEPETVTSDGKEEGIILFKSRWYKKWPFEEAHINKIKGRLLGVGVPESLFNPQNRVNELTHQLRLSMLISSVHLFQTQGNMPVQNLLKDLVNGALVQSDSPITAIANEERNLPAFRDEISRNQEHAKDLTFAYDAIRGGAFPATTAATNATIQDRNANSVFAYKKQDLLISIENVTNEYIKPKLIQDYKKEDLIELVGSPAEISRLNEILSGLVEFEECAHRMLNGEKITPEVLQEVRDAIKLKNQKAGGKKFIGLEDIMKDADAHLEYISSDESEDVSVLAQNNQALLSTLLARPEALQNPIIKKLVFSWADKMGISPIELELAESEQMEIQPALATPKPEVPQPIAQPA